MFNQSLSLLNSQFHPVGLFVSFQETADVDPEDDEKEDEVVEDSDALLDTLTGKPVEEDVLLYAVAVVAPYNALTHFKYKVGQE